MDKRFIVLSAEQIRIGILQSQEVLIRFDLQAESAGFVPELDLGIRLTEAQALDFARQLLGTVGELQRRAHKSS